MRASEINHIISETPDFGINVKNFSIDWKTIVIGLTAQFIIAVGVIKVEFVRKFFPPIKR